VLGFSHLITSRWSAINIFLPCKPLTLFKKRNKAIVSILTVWTCFQGGAPDPFCTGSRLNSVLSVCWWQKGLCWNLWWRRERWDVLGPLSSTLWMCPRLWGCMSPWQLSLSLSLSLSLCPSAARRVRLESLSAFCSGTANALWTPWI